MEKGDDNDPNYTGAPFLGEYSIGIKFLAHRKNPHSYVSTCPFTRQGFDLYLPVFGKKMMHHKGNLILRKIAPWTQVWSNAIRHKGVGFYGSL